jgi:ORF6N domain
MLDRDLAELYAVPTARLNEQVKPNRNRFPDEFMFQLTREEAAAVRSRSQNATLKRGQNIKYLPYALTEHGVALSAVLRSGRAVQMSILIVKAFVRLREVLATHKDLARALEDLRRRQDEQGEQITAIIETINNLLGPGEVPPKRQIGSITDEDGGDGNE